MNLQEAKNYLDSFVNLENKLHILSPRSFKLDRMKKLLNLLDNPHKKLKVIHIAGTKGKGSTAALTANILLCAGRRVGLYTSPHIRNYRERIRVLDEKDARSKDDLFSGCITENELCAGINQIRPAVETLHAENILGQVTFYEFFTALAFLYFQQKRADFVVLETGLGGRLDATNAADALVCALTPVGLEHTHLLGDSLEAIAKEKIAIVKNGNEKVIVGPQSPEAEKVVNDHCAKLNIIPVMIQRNSVHPIKNSLDFQVFDFGGHKDLKLSLLGKHQMYNAATAVEIINALNELNFGIPDEAVYQGLQTVFWPGRFEVIQQDPFVILDGAHTRESMRTLAETIQNFFPGKKVSAVLGFSNDKDYLGICAELKILVDEIILTKADHSRARILEETEIRKIFSSAGIVSTKNVNQAVEIVKQKINPDDVILVTGSLFVVAEFRSLYTI